MGDLVISEKCLAEALKIIRHLPISSDVGIEGSVPFVQSLIQKDIVNGIPMI